MRQHGVEHHSTLLILIQTEEQHLAQKATAL